MLMLGVGKERMELRSGANSGCLEQRAFGWQPMKPKDKALLRAEQWMKFRDGVRVFGLSHNIHQFENIM